MELITERLLQKDGKNVSVFANGYLPSGGKGRFAKVLSLLNTESYNDTPNNIYEDIGNIEIKRCDAIQKEIADLEGRELLSRGYAKGLKETATPGSIRAIITRKQ